MLAPLRMLFARVVKNGNLTIIDNKGRRFEFGDGTGTHVVAAFRDRRAEWQLVLDPELALGELYADGRLTLSKGSIYDFLSILMTNIGCGPQTSALRLHAAVRFALRRLHQLNPVGRSSRNVKHHYDIGEEIYDLFLDDARQYSCAYFENASATLDEAQQAKLRHLVAKLDLKSGQRVLDIGSGWGGLATYIASILPIEMMGITLSPNQLSGSRSRAKAMGLGSRVHFKLQDYRTFDAKFDRIISVGMLEHVGINHYSEYFRKIQQLLNEDGVAVIHTIGRTDGPGYTNPFIAKYIFPGGYFPALSELLPVIEKCGLMVSDIEVLRLHYAETLRVWRERFMANRDKAKAIHGENFCRMWEFYLAGSEAGFRFQGLVVYQIQLIKDVNALPITRNYITEVETALADNGHQRPRLISGTH